jgi:hypothetical protein
VSQHLAAGPQSKQGAATPIQRGLDAFTAGVLAVGIGIGGPWSMVLGLLAGDLRALVVFPAAVVAAVWLWVRREGRAAVLAALRTPPVSRRDLPLFLLGALVTFLALLALLSGGTR